MQPRSKPLYRRVNTRTHNVHHGSGQKAKYARNTKAAGKAQSDKGSMHSGQRHGLDYTPLFRFLLSRVGRDWDVVHAEAVARLDRTEPIFWLVAEHESDREPVVRCSESSYFSGLYVDDYNILQIVDPSVTHETMDPTCACCTHTLNGVRLSKAFGVSEEDGE